LGHIGGNKRVVSAVAAGWGRLRRPQPACHPPQSARASRRYACICIFLDNMHGMSLNRAFTETLQKVFAIMPYFQIFLKIIGQNPSPGGYETAVAPGERRHHFHAYSEAPRFLQKYLELWHFYKDFVHDFAFGAKTGHFRLKNTTCCMWWCFSGYEAGFAADSVYMLRFGNRKRHSGPPPALFARFARSRDPSTTRAYARSAQDDRGWDVIPSAARNLPPPPVLGRKRPSSIKRLARLSESRRRFHLLGGHTPQRRL